MNILFQFLSAEYSPVVGDVNLPEPVLSNDDDMTRVAFVPRFCMGYSPIQSVTRNSAAVKHPPGRMSIIDIFQHAYNPYL